MKTNAELWVIKIGSNSLLKEDKRLNIQALEDLCQQIKCLRDQNIQVILVSSGAVTAGKGLKSEITSSQGEVAAEQVRAALGQPYLMETYRKILADLGIAMGQVLITKNDFDENDTTTNIHNCIQCLLENNILPIVNENDVTSVRELMFTDNDELASLLALQFSADKFVLLTEVKGLYDKNPHDPTAQLIPEVKNLEDAKQYITDEKSHFGRGGMLPKIRSCNKAAHMGCACLITSLATQDVLIQIANGEKCGTWFPPREDISLNNFKKRLLHQFSRAKGKIIIDATATKLFKDHSRARSLLPVGILDVQGDFNKDDLVEVLGADETHIGLGIAEYDAQTAQEYAGLQNKPFLIHYDRFFVYQ